LALTVPVMAAPRAYEIPDNTHLRKHTTLLQMQNLGWHSAKMQQEAGQFPGIYDPVNKKKISLTFPERQHIGHYFGYAHAETPFVNAPRSSGGHHFGESAIGFNGGVWRRNYQFYHGRTLANINAIAGSTARLCCRLSLDVQMTDLSFRKTTRWN